MYWYTYGHKDSVGIYFRSLGFTLLCEFSFRFSYRFSGSHKRSTHVLRIATHSVCFLVCLVAFVLASTAKALTAWVRDVPLTFDHGHSTAVFFRPVIHPVMEALNFRSMVYHFP